MWTALLAQLAEWGITTIFSDLAKWWASYQANQKEQKALQNNDAALASAEKSGSDAAIQKAGENDLNNTNG